MLLHKKWYHICVLNITYYDIHVYHSMLLQQKVISYMCSQYNILYNVKIWYYNKKWYNICGNIIL